jgi:hypothetical protein
VSTNRSDEGVVALAAELARKSGTCWLRHPGEPARAAWHVWHDESLCLVSGGEEQRLPRLDDGDLVEVLMRSADTGGLALTWLGRVSVVRPDDEAWPPTTAALVAGRLNLRDLATAADRWASESTVLRITPTGEAVDGP